VASREQGMEIMMENKKIWKIRKKIWVKVDEEVDKS